MGLAEKTDTLVMLVSEERGEVSYFHMGKMHKAHEPGDIVKAIEERWKDTSYPPFGLSRKETRRNLALQIGASLVLALFFWTTIIFAQRESVERGYTVAVEYPAPAANLVMVGERKREVQLYLGGIRSIIDSLSPSNLSVKIDISSFKPGTQSVFITSEHVEMPRGVSLIEAMPSRLELTLAQVAEHWARVIFQLVGDLREGLRLGSIEVVPERVRVISPQTESGPEILSVTSTPIYLESITRNATILCEIIAPQTVRPADKQWPDVKVTVNVIREPR